jgi:N-acetylglucosamine kinase-like BadF-type ATPase
MGYYLGLIGTAKLSRIAITDENGNIIKVILSPPLTIRVNENIKNYLKITFDQLCTQAGISYKTLLDNLISACFSMSGVYFKSDQYALEQILHQLGFLGRFKLIVCEDANAHLASNFISIGGVIIASTGSNVFIKGFGLDEPIRVDGWGSDIGDDGSGYYLGRRCLRALFKGLDGRIKRSYILEKYVLEHVGLTKIEDLVQWFYNTRITINWRADLADLSIPLIKAAEIENDRLSMKIVKEGAIKLSESMKVAFKKAKNKKDNFNINPCPIILEGGIFEHSNIYRSHFQSKINELSSDSIKWKAIKPKYLPVVGALALAISKNKYIENTNKLHTRLIKSADKLKLFVAYNEVKP